MAEQHDTRSVTYTREGPLALIRMNTRHGNALNPDLFRELSLAVEQAAGDSGVRGVLLTSTGKIFSPGLDLQELLEFDRPAMEVFMDQFGTTLLSLYTFPKPLVAGISGHAIAGGCVLALTADWRILKEGASIGLNEVRVGVPLPFSVALLLREMIRRPFLGEVALLGRNFSGEAAVAAGLVHELCGGDRFEASCISRLEEYASRDPAALAITKKYLRSVTLERMRVGDSPYRCEFLDCWFSPGTRRNIQAIVAGLQKRSG
ncbi:MAG: enoyl-CoA hydratase/isomerase family protein [Acidobacteriota bacterium]